MTTRRRLLIASIGTWHLRLRGGRVSQGASWVDLEAWAEYHCLATDGRRHGGRQLPLVLLQQPRRRRRRRTEGNSSMGHVAQDLHLTYDYLARQVFKVSGVPLALQPCSSRLNSVLSHLAIPLPSLAFVIHTTFVLFLLPSLPLPYII